MSNSLRKLILENRIKLLNSRSNKTKFNYKIVKKLQRQLNRIDNM